MVETIIHIIVGISSFFLCVITAILGATMAGRFGKERINKKVFKTHKYLSILTGLFMITAFLIMAIEGELEFEGEIEAESLHGAFGFAIFLLALLSDIR